MCLVCHCFFRNVDNSNHNSSCYTSFGNATSISATSVNANTVHSNALSAAEDDHADLLANIISDTLTENGLDIGQNMPQQLEPALQYVR